MSTASSELKTDASTKNRAGSRPKQERKADASFKPQPPHGVVLHNDHINSFDFVIRCLRRVFGYDAPTAFLLTMRAHSTGRSLVWKGMKEHAEFKADQLTACGPDPIMRSRGARPLGVSVVPLEDD